MAGFETLDAMPSVATAGDAIPIALDDLTDLYPVDDYSLTVSLRIGSADAVTVELEDADGLHAGTLPISQTPGALHYAIKATRLADDVAMTVERGVITVAPDPALADPRSHAERMLDAIEALLENRASKDVQSYAIAGRNLTKLTVDELQRWRRFYRSEVARERGSGRRITLMSFC